MQKGDALPTTLAIPRNPHLLDESAREEIQRLLTTPGISLRLSPALEQRFRHYSLQELLHVIDKAWLGLLCLIAFVLLGGFLVFRKELLAGEGYLVMGVATINVLLIAAFLAVAHLRLGIFVRYHRFFVPSFFTFMLSDLMYMAVVQQEPRLSYLMLHISMITVLVTTQVLRLDIALAAGACLLSAALGMGLAWLLGHTADWSALAYAYATTVGVGLFMGWLYGRQECITFLQSILLAHEAAVRSAMNQELDRLARTDQLTGVANRRHLEEALEREWARARRDKTPLSLMFIDVDHFKLYNDYYGHQAGDLCLAKVARAIASCAHRPSDLAARFGGEEFVVMLPATDLDGAMKLAGQLQAAVDALALPHLKSQTAEYVTISVGVASRMPLADELPEALIDEADQAVYEAKRQGRHRCMAASL